jgi:cytochrome P450
MLFVSSANRDETIFPSPDKFDISRSPNKHIGFGFGVHYCLGASLAKMQLKVLIEQLLKICPNIGISNGFTPAMKYGTFLRGVKNLEVTI